MMMMIDLYVCCRLMCDEDEDMVLAPTEPETPTPLECQQEAAILRGLAQYLKEVVHASHANRTQVSD